MKTVAYTFAAAKGLRKLPAQVQADIRAKLARLAETGGGEVKALKGREEARIRVGDYRAIFLETETEITVVKVGHRKDVYK